MKSELFPEQSTGIALRTILEKDSYAAIGSDQM